MGSWMNHLALRYQRKRTFKQARLELFNYIINKVNQSNRLMSTFSIIMAINYPDIQVLGAMDCIKKLLNKYPFDNDKQREIVQINKEHDFQFSCTPIFIESSLNNFLSNGLRSVEKAGKGKINIWLSQDNGYSILNFKDTGLGMSDDLRAHVFERFLSKRGEDIIPGLGFCKMAMLYAGGDVVCDSVDGEYTHFMVRFSKC